MNNCGLLVIRRGNWLGKESHCQQENLVKSSAPWSCDEIIQKYRGIEGLPWPEEDGTDMLSLENGLAPISKLILVRNYFQRVSMKYPVDFIFICFPSDKVAANIEVPVDFLFLGYDYGNYISEFNLYSSLLNEVIWGKYEEMQDYTRFLNDYLLFPEVEIIDKLDGTRRKLLEKGADLETEEEGEEFGPIMIYQPEGS